MVVRKISPHNLSEITKHFQDEIREAKKKLGSLNKKRVALERQLALFEDGLEFCNQLYSRHKSNGAD